MSKRKPHNMHKRMQSSTGALLRQHGVCVVNIDPSNRQGLISMKTLKNVRHSRQMANAVCDYAHEWVIYIGVMCIDQTGLKYMKSVEVAPLGRYKSDTLADVIETHYKQLIGECNPLHIVASGWIANPSGVELDEASAARIFEAAGVWTDENINAGKVAA